MIIPLVCVFVKETETSECLRGNRVRTVVTLHGGEGGGGERETERKSLR